MTTTQEAALITGAAKGIGRGIAEQLAREGYRVVLVDRLEAVHEVAASLREGGATVHSEVLDIRDRAAVAALVERYAPFDVIVNNAAITSTHRFEDLTEENFRETFDINAVGTFVVAQEGARRMKNGGRIVNIASRSFAGAPQMAHYAASKTAVVGLTRAMAIDLSPRDIRVNAIAPGVVDTDMLHYMTPNGRPPCLGSSCWADRPAGGHRAGGFVSGVPRQSLHHRASADRRWRTSTGPATTALPRNCPMPDCLGRAPPDTGVLACQFTRERVRPLADRLDPVKGEIPRDLIDEMAELGYFGISHSRGDGGLGLGAFEYCLVAEELARGWMSVASMIARGNSLIGSLNAMTPAQKKVYLPRMAAGDFRAFSLSEPDAGSDVANISCRAKRVGDEWEITGNKYWCTFADGADFILVFDDRMPDHRSEGPAPRHLGVHGGEAARPTAGGRLRAPIPKIGYFGWTTWELAFDKCRVPAQNIIGEEGRGFYLATAGLETARAHTAARSIGLAQAGLDDAVRHAKERRQFGNPIASFQAIRFKIASMATEIEAARSLMYTVCDKIDQGVRCDKEASMVKLFASEMSERVTSEALQIHGGGGYTTLNQVERHWRDARLTKIFEGHRRSRCASSRIISLGGIPAARSGVPIATPGRPWRGAPVRRVRPGLGDPAGPARQRP